MAAQRLMVAAAALGLLGAVACSKTQDTAPEQRIFGSPPSIQSVSVTAGTGDAQCDITKVFQGYICSLDPTVTPDTYSLVPGPTLSVDVTYSRTLFDVKVTDPENTPTQTDILLVSASYLTPPEQGQKPEETSLVLFDDGGSNTFPYLQGSGAPEACTIDVPNGICSCQGAQYTLESNDPTANDSIFTRTFAFVAPGAGVPSGTGAFALIENCIASSNHEYPTSGTKFLNKTVPFKIEAVDREGNLTAWPTQPSVAVGPTGFTCTGDECACCLLTSSNTGALPPEGCKGLPGVVGNPGSPFEGIGLCTTFP